MFEDGAETQMECNKCVCACGNWVCTALTCTGENCDFTMIVKGLIFFSFSISCCCCYGNMTICISGEHQVEEDDKEGAEEEEMTEEEWSRRVAELNALQVDSQR